MRTLIEDGYIVTMDFQDRILDPGSVLIDEGTIRWVGQGELPPEHASLSPDRRIDAQRRIVIPGLVNCHLHSTAGYWKGIIDALPLEPFLLYAHPYAASLRLSSEQLYLRHMTSAIEMLETGTTSAIDDAIHMPSPADPHPDVALEAYRDSVQAAVACYRDVGMRTWVTCNVADRIMYDTIPWFGDLLPAEYRDEFDARPFPGTQQLIDFLDDLLGSFAGSSEARVRLALAPNGSTRCSDELLIGTSRLAHRYGTPVVSHIQESKAEFLLDRARYGQTAVAHLSDLGILDARFGLVHAVWLTPEDIEIVARSGCSVITNPISNLKLGSGVAPILDLLQQGANVALGTDGPTANDSANLFEDMKVLAVLQRLWSPDFERWPGAAQVLGIATRGGAYAVGRADELGAIEAGRRADLTLLDAGSVAYMPFHEPVHQIVYADVGASVDMVLVDGDVVVEGGRVTTIDREGILEAFADAYREIIPVVRDAMRRAERYRPSIDEAYRRSAREMTPVNPVLWLR